MRLAFPTRLRSRLSLLLIGVLLPCVILEIVSANIARQRERSLVQQEAYRLARLVGAGEVRLSQTTEQLLLTLSRIPAVAEAASGCDQELAAVLSGTPRFQNLGVIDRAGRVRCAAVPAITRDVSRAAWFVSALERKQLTVGPFEASGVSSKPTVVFSRQTTDPNDVAQVAFAALDLDALAAVIADVPVPSESAVNVVSLDGTILARVPEHAQWVGRNMKDHALIQLARENGQGVAESVGVDNVRRLYGYYRVPMPDGSGLIVTVGMPLRLAYRAADARLQTSLIALAAVAVVSLLAARYAADRLLTSKIDALVRAARRISAGDLSARTELQWTADELGQLARSFDAMAWTLEQRDMQMTSALESLRALTARLETVREEERSRISREIHDELGQLLTGIRMDISMLSQRLERTELSAANREPLTSKLESARILAERALETSRRVSRQLRPSVLDVLGLKASFEWQLEEFTARTGIATELQAGEWQEGVGDQINVTLFRILQEALTNVARHAAATQVRVVLARSAAVTLEITDNGRGFVALATSRQSIGLLGMRERAALVGGEVEIESAPGHGTTIRVRIPMVETAG